MGEHKTSVGDASEARTTGHFPPSTSTRRPTPTPVGGHDQQQPGQGCVMPAAPDRREWRKRMESWVEGCSQACGDNGTLNSEWLEQLLCSLHLS